jgi:hypothetical protein
MIAPLTPEFFQRFIQHSDLRCRRRIFEIVARAPAMAGTVDQDHAMMLSDEVAERPHRFEI